MRKLSGSRYLRMGCGRALLHWLLRVGLIWRWCRMRQGIKIPVLRDGIKNGEITSIKTRSILSGLNRFRFVVRKVKNNMSNQQAFKAPSDLVIQLEIVSEDEQYPDIADIEEVSREIVDYFRENGYTVEPTYTATKGNPTFDIIVHIYQIIHDNKELITATFSTASLVLQYLLKERDGRAEKEKTQRSPLEITFYVNDQAVSLDTSHLTESTKQFQNTLSEKADRGADSLDKAKIQIRVPKRKRHHR